MREACIKLLATLAVMVANMSDFTRHALSLDKKNPEHKLLLDCWAGASGNHGTGLLRALCVIGFRRIQAEKNKSRLASVEKDDNEEN